MDLSITLLRLSRLTLSPHLTRGSEFSVDGLVDLLLSVRRSRIRGELLVPVRLGREHVRHILLVILPSLVPIGPALLQLGAIGPELVAERVELRQALVECLLTRIAAQRLLERDVERLAVSGYLVPLGVLLTVPFGRPPLVFGRPALGGRETVGFGGDGPEVFRLILGS